MGSTAWNSNPGVGKGFYFLHTQSERHRSPPSLLYSRYQLSFPAVKRPGRGVDQISASNTEVKEKEELTSTPHLCLHDMSGRGLYFYIYINILLFTWQVQGIWQSERGRRNICHFKYNMIAYSCRVKITKLECCLLYIYALRVLNYSEHISEIIIWGIFGK
jgi:hypothetical protein